MPNVAIVASTLSMPHNESGNYVSLLLPRCYAYISVYVYVCIYIWLLRAVDNGNPNEA